MASSINPASSSTRVGSGRTVALAVLVLSGLIGTGLAEWAHAEAGPGPGEGTRRVPVGSSLPQETAPTPPGRVGASRQVGASGCTRDMVRVGRFCIDRWEASMVDAKTDRELSPFYPPHPQALRRVRALWQREREFSNEPQMPLPDLPAWQRKESFSARAVSRADAVPQAYLTYHLAKRACEAAGKRLCEKEEWLQACRGQQDRAFPYGEKYEPGKCNVFRHFHPSVALHGASWYGHTDPRLNLVHERGEDPLLRLTGKTLTCASEWYGDRIYDMVGNLDEWVADSSGIFVGGFYARNTRSGCEAEVRSHAPSYFDYSIGTRCCADLPSQ